MPQRGTSDSQDLCTIVVLYDGEHHRSRALAACDYLVNQFWQNVELKFHWWRTDFLLDPQLARLAAENAVAADFLIYCSESTPTSYPALESWFESWLERRGEVNGALLDLQPAGANPERERFLREVCRRGCFDYFTSVPNGGAGRSAASSATRSLAGTIDEILGDTRPPSHYGLNE